MYNPYIDYNVHANASMLCMYLIGCMHTCTCMCVCIYMYVRMDVSLHVYYLLQQCDDLQYQVLMESLVHVQPKLYV